MKIGYWIIAVVIVGAATMFLYYNADTLFKNAESVLVEDSTTSDSTEPVGLIEDDPEDGAKDSRTPEIITETHVDDPDGNADTATTDPDLKTFSNEAYGFAFDYDKDYYWNATKNTYSIYITNDAELAELSYAGYIPDDATEFRVDFETYNVGDQSIEDFMTSNFPVGDPDRQVTSSTFRAQNISGIEYAVSKSSDPNIGPGVNNKSRYISFKDGDHLYLFTIDGSDTLRDKIVSSFRTI